MKGPLDGVRVIELAGLGALPFGTLKLADMGADIIRVDRVSDVPAVPEERPRSAWDRGHRSIAVDLKQAAGVETVLRLAESADVILEAFRPGVVERLGLGPDAVRVRNERIVYGRLTGWGQVGPLSQSAAHSLNYEAITGVTHSIGPVGGPPVPALTVLGDFAGGGLNLAYGVVCALLEARTSGKGQVVDAAMIDGVVSLLTPFYSMHQLGMHTDEIGTNLFDGGAPFYAIYETSDGKYVSVAPIEPHFYALLIQKLGLDSEDLPDQNDRARWPELKERLAAVFKTRTRDEWCAELEGTDACFAPVLTLAEAQQHPHQVARASFAEGTPMPEPAPAPRLSRTPGRPGPSPRWQGADTDTVLAESGFSAEEIAGLRSGGAIA